MIKSYISSYIAPILDDKRFTMILLARSRYFFMRHRLGLFLKRGLDLQTNTGRVRTRQYK